MFEVFYYWFNGFNQISVFVSRKAKIALVIEHIEQEHSHRRQVCHYIAE